MTRDPIGSLRAALDATGEIVAAIGPTEWALPTPCPEWPVRGVVNHLVAGNLLFARVLAGEDLPTREELAAASRTDRLGDDAVAAYRQAADGLVGAFMADGVLQRTVTVPLGQVPGIAALQLRIVESLVHGWDVARATGRPARFSEELTEQALRFTRATLADVPPAPPGRAPFGPPQTVADDAPALDRLAALLGRRVEGSEGRAHG